MPSEPISQFVEPQQVNVPVVEAPKPAVETTPVSAPVTTPPADTKIPLTAQEDAVVNFKDFLEVTGENQREESAPTVKLETKPTETPKPETTIETKPANQPVVVDELEDKAGNKRDYTGLEESEIPLFKRMSNKSFDVLKPKFIESKKQAEQLKQHQEQIETLKKGALPDNYLEHEKAYILTPQFENAANKAIKANMIVNHWNEQLAKVRKGDDTYQEIHINNQGEFVYSKPVKASAESEKELEALVDGSKEQHLRVQNELQIVAANHQAKHQESLTQLRNFENVAFKAITEGENAKVVEPIINDIINKTFPAAFHNSPLIKPLAKALYIINQLALQIKNAQPTSPTTKTANGVVDKSKLNPTAGDMSGGASTNSNEPVVTMDDFNAVIGRR